MNNSPAMQTILSAVADACSAILAHYHPNVTYSDVAYKGDNTPLTQADLAAHRILSDSLSAIAGLPVISEEGAITDYAERAQWPAYWLIDPLDGTKEFIAGSGEFSVNVALVVGGRAVLGVIAGPVSGNLYAGLSVASPLEQAQISRLLPGISSNAEAFSAKIDSWAGFNPQQELSWSRIFTVQPRQRIKVLTSRSHHGLEANHYLAGLKEVEAMPMGSSLKMCFIAEGLADLYVRLGPTSEWDTAAAQAILEGAGGQLLDLKGNPLRYNQKASLLNPAFWASSQYFSINNAGAISLKESELNADNHQ